MTKNKTITDYRLEIDQLDQQIKALLIARLKAVEAIGAIKKDRQQAVLDQKREAEIISNLCSMLDSKDQVAIQTIYQTIFKVSKNRQTSND